MLSRPVLQPPALLSPENVLATVFTTWCYGQLFVTHERDDSRHQSSYWREAARDAGLLAETYESACLFIHVNNHAHNEPCATSAPLWNDGANHIMMEFTDWSR